MSVLTLMERARIDARLTRGALADKSGVAPRTIRALESGRVASPRDETLFPLADALSLDPVDLKADFARVSRHVERVRATPMVEISSEGEPV